MQTLSTLLQQFDANLHHKYESLEYILAGLTDPEATWQAPCYAAEPEDANGPPPGTILWQLDHVSGCNRHYVIVLRHRHQQELPDSPPGAPPSSIAAALAELQASHAALRDEVANLTDADLSTPCGHGAANVGDFLASCLRHEIWHAGQIAVLRRLYRQRP